MKKKLLFGILLALLLTPWPVAYAYDNGPEGSYPVTVTEAEASRAPHLDIFRSAIGSVTPGDLFYIDATDTTMDVSFILFFTNVDRMITTYRYMNLAVGVYAEAGDDNWMPVANYGNGAAEFYLTMRTGSIEFTVSGYNRYKITIDRGSFYALPGSPDAPVVLPEFYISPL